MADEQADSTAGSEARERFGIRIALYPDDPFRHLMKDGWETHHWFASATLRDRALESMRSRHIYSRDSDTPRMIFEAVER